MSTTAEVPTGLTPDASTRTGQRLPVWKHGVAAAVVAAAATTVLAAVASAAGVSFADSTGASLPIAGFARWPRSHEGSRRIQDWVPRAPPYEASRAEQASHRQDLRFGCKALLLASRVADRADLPPSWPGSNPRPIDRYSRRAS